MSITNRDYNYLFVSDLHLSEGQDPASGRLSRNEDFFYDDAFADFLAYHLRLGRREGTDARFRRPWRLVINGDLFDFLQVTGYPQEEAELAEVLGGIPFTSNKKRYGLGTSSRETEWKLRRVATGHPLFFQTLGWFLAAHPHNELIVIKGNHDVELFWTAVQRRFRELIGAAYSQWRQQTEAGLAPDSPLPRQGVQPPEHQWPATLDVETLRHRVHFPAWYYYEPSLFYAEHGNQYDPANAFVDFLEPILAEDPAPPPDEQQVELPSGSFFVRYFFNKVEQVHPFADNIKPLTRYLRWALLKQPGATVRMLINNWHEIWGIASNLWRKEADPVEGRPELQQSLEQKPVSYRRGPADTEMLALSPERRERLEGMRREHLRHASRRSQEVSRKTVLGLALNGSQYLWLARALRHFNEGAYGRMVRDLALAAISFVVGTVMGRELDMLAHYAELPAVGRKVALILNEPAGEEQRTAAVPFHLFGHDHHPDLVEIEDEGTHAPSFRQWYVNAGSWLSSFDEQARLTRGDVQFTFFRLIPDGAGQDHLAQLLEWLPRRQSTRPILLFAGGDGFDVAVEDIPEVRA